MLRNPKSILGNYNFLGPPMTSKLARCWQVCLRILDAGKSWGSCPLVCFLEHSATSSIVSCDSKILFNVLNFHGFFCCLIFSNFLRL